MFQWAFFLDNYIILNDTYQSFIFFLNTINKKQ